MSLNLLHLPAAITHSPFSSSPFATFSPLSHSCRLTSTPDPRIRAGTHRRTCFSCHATAFNQSLSFSFNPPTLCGTDTHRFGFNPFRASAASGGGAAGGSGDSSGGGGGGGGGGGSGDGGGSSTNLSLLSWYMTLLVKTPVLTKAVTSAFLGLIGDLICQVAIDQVQSLDLKRMFVFTLLGFVVGPTLHYWYLYLSTLVTVPGASGAFLRLLLDQFLFSPIFIGAFLSALVTLEGRPWEAIPKLQQGWFSAVLANWQLWIPFQFLNFQFVPQHLQVLAANLIALIWNVILSFKAHSVVPLK